MKPTSAERKWRQKRRLYMEQKGLCHYCRKFMRIMKWLTDYGHQPDDLATIEHLDDRFSPDRGKRAGERRHVLACRKCNWEKARESVASQPIEELRRRSRRGVDPVSGAEDRGVGG